MMALLCAWCGSALCLVWLCFVLGDGSALCFVLGVVLLMALRLPATRQSGIVPVYMVMARLK